ncbi:MAG: hypothetical protein HY709_10710 [Candidatus Latescibacteria bacterium]|nr:hypothetical protein [Candidatus Latescibacterota bacterium]
MMCRSTPYSTNPNLLATPCDATFSHDFTQAPRVSTPRNDTRQPGKPFTAAVAEDSMDFLNKLNR